MVSPADRDHEDTLGLLEGTPDNSYPPFPLTSIFRLQKRLTGIEHRTETLSTYEELCLQLQHKINLGGDTEAATQKQLDKLSKDMDDIKRTIKEVRQVDRRLGEAFACSGYRTRKTAIGDSCVDWALLRIPEARMGHNVVCERRLVMLEST
jgi:hypothetical protein